ncbi:MAG: hypothetical protein JOY63_05825 [Acetobacteraceae bacterium]|nr:hypothetical protein [Acetobacteraceae bacterium]
MENETGPLDPTAKTILVRPRRSGGDAQEAGGAPQAWELLARFRSTEALDNAIRALEAKGFERQDLGLPEIDPAPERATPEAGSKPADTDVEARQARVMHASTGGSMAAMVAGTAAAAATGGVAAAVAGAALGAGAAVAGATSLLSGGLSHAEQIDREQKAREGRLVLAVLAKSDERRDHAVTILQGAGGELVN